MAAKVSPTRPAKLKIKRGDSVVVIAGRSKGIRGDVLKVFPAENRVIVQGANLVKRHTKPTQFNQGGIVEKEAPIHVSNVAIADPESGEPTRVGYKWLDDRRKVRFAKRSGEVIDR